MKGGIGRYTYHLVHALRKKKKINKNIDVHIAIGSHSEARTTTTSPEIVKNSSNNISYNNADDNNKDSNEEDDDDAIYYGIVKKGDRKNSDRLLYLIHELKPDIVNIQYERGLYEIDTTVHHMLRRVLYGSTLDKFYKDCPVPTVSTLHTVFPYDEYQDYIKERALTKEGRFASLPLSIRVAIRKWVMERRYDLLLEVGRLSSDIISPARTIYDIVKRGTVIYHGAEPSIPSVSSYANKQEFRKEFGLPDDKRLLLAFGYVGSYKGFDILDSLSLPDGWSLVVKQNRHERGIEKPIYIKNAINLHLGYLDDVTLSKLFFACDVIIFPYKVVSISGVLFDALAHGLPFIASDLKFFREFAQMGLGITCNRNAISFSEKIVCLASDHTRYKNNVQQFNPKLRWSNIADNHIDLFSKILGRS
jgi:glycosyltransferase involved in cell wall biosynthesis